MEFLRLRLLTVWTHYWLHHTLQKAAEVSLGLVVVGGTVTTVVTVAPIRHKQPVPKPMTSKTVSKPAVKPVVHPKPLPAVSQPAPAATTPAPKPVTKSVVAQQAPQPIPTTQPSPGSTVKRLVSTPPASSSTSSSGSTQTSTTPADGNSASSQPSSAPAAASGGYYSTNWAGYAALSGKFTAVSGSWTVPAVTGDGTDSTGDAAWIGIGGANTDDLVQTGTADTVTAGGSVSTYAFYELLPDAALRIRLLDVSAGDHMTAAISELSSGQWTISISDSTTGHNYTTTVAYTSSYSSAEWIEEDPSYSDGSLVPFASFDHVVFSDASTTQNGSSFNLASSNAAPITLVDSNGMSIVTPSVLINSGTGFWATHT